MKPTHTTSTPNKAISPLDSVKVKLASKETEQQLLNLLGSEEEVRRFQTLAIEYVRKVPKLLETNRTSLMMALLTAAQFRFSPSNVAGEAYIIPYGNDANFQLGYQGYVTLLYRAGTKDIKTVIVFKNDKFRYEEGLSTILEHIPTPFGEERGEPIAVYAVATTPTGGKVFKVMRKEEVMRIKDISKAGGKKDSPWNSGDPELWMWRKTCLIQLAKLLPKTPDIQRALEIDYEGEGFDKPRLDIGGPATARVSHKPAEEPPAPPAEDDSGVAKCEKHGVALDGDGECQKCVAEALDKPGELGTIEV